ncbi:MAG: hypothetical protein FWF29_11595, partial [Treponema sp.]|nr:hypothetical protein [Treponema sp.]
MIMAIDQGSTKTSVVFVSAEGKIAASVTTGGACYFSVGVEAAFREIHSAVEKAGVPVHDIRRIYGGIAGANWPDEIEMLKRELGAHFGVQDVSVSNDCVVALRGGTDKPDAIVLCAGTGFNGAVMTDRHIRHVFNNYVDSNDQGGGALGGRAFQAVFESFLGIREKTVLTPMLMEYYGYERLDQLLLGRDRSKLKYPLQAAVAILTEAASRNDPVALDVIFRFSKSIARYATGGLKKYHLVGKDCDIVLSGGVFKSEHPLFYETISSEVHRVSTQAHV